MKICIINFSSRADGNCAQIADVISAEYSNDEPKYYDFSAFQIEPCGKCHYECFKKRENCPYFTDKAFEIFETVTESDLAFYIVPNYCDYPCANFFVLNERSQCYFQNHWHLISKYLAVPKMFIVVSNTNQSNFREVFRYHLQENCAPRILFLSAKEYHKSSIAGDLLAAEAAKVDLLSFIREER
jgi:multimeric flavodoxin WrbA